MAKDVEAFVAQLMLANSAEREHIYKQLMLSYQREAKIYELELSLIRQRINALLAGPYMPTTDAISFALYPDRFEIENRADLILEAQNAKT